MESDNIKDTKHIRRGKSGWGGDRHRERENYSKERVGSKEERKDEGGVGGCNTDTLYCRAQGYTEKKR